MFLGPVWKIPTSLSLRLYFSAAQWPSDWIPQAWSVKADASHDIFRAWDCDYTDGAPWLHPVATGFFPTAPWAHGAKDGHHLKPGRWPRVAAGAYWLFRAKPWWKGFDSEKNHWGSVQNNCGAAPYGDPEASHCVAQCAIMCSASSILPVPAGSQRLQHNTEDGMHDRETAPASASALQSSSAASSSSSSSLSPPNSQDRINELISSNRSTSPFSNPFTPLDL